MAKAPAWEPPPDPDLMRLACTGYDEWRLDAPKVVAFDTETTGLEYHDRAFGASIAWVHDDVLTGTRDVRGHWFDFDRGSDHVAPTMVREILSTADVLVAHNAKFDLHKLETSIGWMIRPDQQLHDTEAMAHLLDEHRPKGLKELAISVLGWDDTMMVTRRRKDPDTGQMVDVQVPVPESKYLIDKARDWAKKEHGLRYVKDVGYHLLPRSILVPYAVLDAVWTYNLASVLYPSVAAYPEVLDLYWNTEMRLSRGAIYNLERAGMGTRPDYVAEQIKEYRKRCLMHEQAMEAMVGKPVRRGDDIPAKERERYFNPSSSSPDAGAFLAAAGFERESYDAENLRGIDHPLAQLLLQYRKDTKLLEGYFVALQAETGPDGIFHPSLRQHGTVSGRTSAGAERGD